MVKYTTAELRTKFIDFFKSKGHMALPSFSLIPQDDPSVLLINAGMTPMKAWFTGAETPPAKRVCTCQKCVRTGDIDLIGTTDRHCTYFEMLGNFSFGDYGKHEAIKWAWEFLTSEEWIGLDPDRLYPSIFETDEEAFRVWNEEIGVPAERIYRFGREDNFWEHGAGPCGPCSEIYYDRGADKGCGRPDCHVGCDCDRFIEVWNVVFSELENDGNGNYTPLKQKNIDTGMGLERLACVVQEVDSAFDVDSVRNITDAVSSITGAHYGDSHKTDVALRIITDHIRSSVFMISDGITPSNEGRGYVLRRLLRRAARHGRQLGVEGTFLHKLCDVVVRENAAAYPELAEKQSFIEKVIENEEETFARTLETGMRIMDQLVREHVEHSMGIISGRVAFTLHDTYGFPLDLTRDIAEEAGLEVDEAGFTKCMEEQRRAAKTARESAVDGAWQDMDLKLDGTPTAFVGYSEREITTIVRRVIRDDEIVDSAVEGEKATLVLEVTNMYAEMGGQVADQGIIKCGNGVFEVSDVQRNRSGKVLHYGTVLRGRIGESDRVKVAYDTERRQAVSRAHTATHLLNAALRKVLGDHVHQAGSYVSPDKLRFDFTNFSPLSDEQLAEVNSLVQEEILRGENVVVREMPIEKARKLGAQALFGEKYGDIVRVVSVGDGFSVEFCGGTHVTNTALVGPFRVVSQSSVSAGVRRVEAYVGKMYYSDAAWHQRTVSDVAAALKAPADRILERVLAREKALASLSESFEVLQAKMRTQETDTFMSALRTVRGLHVATYTYHSMKIKELRQQGDIMRSRDPKIVAVIAAISHGKVTFLALCGQESVDLGLDARELIERVTAACSVDHVGNGGGHAESAMGGGKNLLLVDNALAVVDDYVVETLDRNKKD